MNNDTIVADPLERAGFCLTGHVAACSVFGVLHEPVFTVFCRMTTNCMDELDMEL
ncbi:hypothetical protein [Neobacillus drentensis]|uniref:hypothetical protein n=1 Tax=Neobacillus drentensis TaxID=220684 RepID=UPI0030004B61